MYFDHFSEEKLIAFKAVLREHDLDNRRQDIADLFAMSVGRAYWKYWQEFDRRDDEIVVDGHGQVHQTDGWPEAGGSQLDIWRRKWSRRAALFTSWHYDDIHHVLDWIIAAAQEPAPWIANVDKKGRPKKLMKCGDMTRLVHEADKGMRRQNASLSEKAAQLGIDDELFLFDLGAGYTLVRLLSTRALDIESARMHHCIGHGAYDQYLASDDIQLFSIRDQVGEPKATLEVMNYEGRDYLIHFFGPWNCKPEDHLNDLIVQLDYGTKAELQKAENRQATEFLEQLLTHDVAAPD